MQFFYNLLYGKINKKSSTCVTSTIIRSFVYRAFASCIVRPFRVSFVCVFRIVRSFHFVRVSCVFRIVRSFAFGAYYKLIRSRICTNNWRYKCDIQDIC